MVSGSFVNRLLVRLLIACFFAAAASLVGCGGHAEHPAAAPSNESAASGPPATDFGALVGRWVRPDGGYVLEIDGVGLGGELQAAYFNPNPIHVSQASVARVKGEAQIFIELRDTGYAGATYTLTHDAARDELTGLYYQPAAGRNFDVVFVRVP